jgi:glycosyltransferase involved in cell wall biosynthesis
MTPAKVTIGIPTYNRVAFLREALTSALTQSYTNLEIIVSVNASTDDTGVFLSGQRDGRLVILSHTENRGMVANWNACLHRATGEYFLLLSDDDILEPNAIAKLLDGFASSTIRLSYGPVRNIHESGAIVDTFLLKAPQMESGRQFFANIISGKTGAFPSATMFRAADGRAHGGYPNIGTAADLGLHIQLAMKGSVSFTPIPVARYRVHAGAESFSRSVISSQASLVDWISRADHSLAHHRDQIIRYCSMMIYGWGRYHALRGNKSESRYAISMLRKIRPGSLHWLAICFFELQSVRWLIAQGKKIKVRLQALRSN